MREEERGAVERLIVVDGELTGQLDLVGRCLLAPLADPGTAAHRPSPTLLPADPTAVLGALQRLTGAVSAAVARGPRVWAPNGRWEHAGLRLVRLPPADVDLLYAALRELSAAMVAPSADAAGGSLAPLLADLAAAAGQAPAALVGALARVLAAVDLMPDGDTALLTDALRSADGEDVRLTTDEEEAWQRLAHRVTMVLTESVPLHRFLG
ncbi:hypothetical protein [Peterkaempfera sp. SMS 1(5)a]|uniref:hypothetical protein n=1 Tax=Peterkaempfera podocarpi TaxID=3232308 RepID=UPI0036712B8E